jgi:hypothetical protein
VLEGIKDLSTYYGLLKVRNRPHTADNESTSTNLTSNIPTSSYNYQTTPASR